MIYEPVIGLEVHAELATASKMFCSCPVVDPTRAEPNTAVCPVCCGMPGTLPVVNQKAVEYAVRVALALDCQLETTSLFARKNYFYPDLPKGYQISQYEYPLAQHGRLSINAGSGERVIRIRRVHMEEDTGKLTHVTRDGESYSLVDLNRAGVPLVEIVSEPDIRSVEEMRAYAEELRAILRGLRVNSGDMEKGVIRFEANVSVRPTGSEVLGTRVEIKNLNSFRALERSVHYEVRRQSGLLNEGEAVRQETLGWDEENAVTVSQRSKEEAHDYRYFPEPDLPPLVVEPEWIRLIADSQPELPRARIHRLQKQYDLTAYEAEILGVEPGSAAYFEDCLAHRPDLNPHLAASWITGEIFGWLKLNGKSFADLITPTTDLAELLNLVGRGLINPNTAKQVLAEMLAGGKTAATIITARGLKQIDDVGAISSLVQRVVDQNPGEVKRYLEGKETVANWFFGQVMRLAGGQASPLVVRSELERKLAELKR